MTRFLAVLLIVTATVATASGQAFRPVAGTLGEQGDAVSSLQVVPSPFTSLHISDALLRSPAGQAALQAFHDQKASGQLPLSKGAGSTAVVGQSQLFKVYNIKTESYEDIDFTLNISRPTFNLWVETSQLAPAGPVQQADLDALALAIGEQTPSGSFNPDAGIIPNDEVIFGQPPNVDGDGKTDILLHDIRDNYDPNVSGSSAVLGFFDPADLSSPSVGNFRDIVHLDIMPAMYSSTGSPRPQAQIHQTLAHEYQHLIFSSSSSGLDETFINEGLSEWAEIQNGYTPRFVSYLSKPTEWNQSMLHWRTATGGGPGNEDYQRAGLFTNYLSERIGVSATGGMARSTGQGVGKYIVELNNLTGGDGANTLQMFVQGFHIANLINDQTVAQNYGHAYPPYSGLQATNLQVIDGRASLTMPTVSGSLNPGGTQYIQWTEVGDFTLDIRTTPSSHATRLRPVLILDDGTGTPRVVDADIGGEGTFVTGNFESVLLVLPHVDVTTTSTVSYTVNASWSEKSTSLQFSEVSYDNGMIPEEQAFWVLGESIPEDGRFGNRFETPVGMRLESVDVAVFYEDLFRSTTSTVRDFTLRLYTSTETAQSQFLPDEEVLAVDVFDTKTPTSPELAFHTVNLTSEAYEEAIQSLGNTFFVSIENAGQDDNHIWVGMSTYSEVDNPGVLYHPFKNGTYSWGSFNTIQSNGEVLFATSALPVRARFSDRPFTSTSVGEASELPVTAVLDQNWPNPFNPSTTISFELNASGPVTLTVHDLLGRKIETLVDNVLPAGVHRVRFNADSQASGLYLYTLQTATSRDTKTMLLVK